MTDAPERITARYYANGIINARRFGEKWTFALGNALGEAEYTRADIARNEALERAAREAENHLPKDHWEARDSTAEYNKACRDIAAAIRALKT